MIKESFGILSGSVIHPVFAPKRRDRENWEVCLKQPRLGLMFTFDV